ncbi:class II aldolase/adducin family protein [Chitinasiproducens palmae]|uniref:Ribulose-5-phosphate 4-epimerase/Fuculose-1-phosphate aldolase n=1 Tax=Chitinasiproducens palmae TaxID=1770053 RepID=A0A1H2PQ87_9BURK|nr:class II aldolase/adducin family protein [Chitinasiproducens palmae]SDV48964.1 Ribulose-5-phosphate 4-epimerase/Fuculose-1-phosphate aldolase [Chitinasiproducens palmae]
MSADTLAPVLSPVVSRDHDHRPAHISTAEWQARVALAASYRLMAAAGVNDLTYNHLSARVPGEPDRYLIKGERQLFEQVTASSLLKYDLDGNKLSDSSDGVSRGGQVIHAGVFAARPDIHAVFHTHTTANLAVSMQKIGLLPLNQHALRVYSRVGYHPFSGFEFDLASRKALADSLADKYFLVMRNHGALICGRTIPEAYVEHHNFEFACRAQVAALTAGGIEQLIVPTDEVIAHATAQVERFLSVIDENGRDWGALLAQAYALDADFAR